MDTFGTTHTTVWNERFKKLEQINEYLTKIGSNKKISKPEEMRQLCGSAKEKNKQIDNYQITFDAYKKICTRFGDNLF